MDTLPYSIIILFVATTLATLWLLYRASGNSKNVLTLSIVWLALQGLVAYSEFYLNTTTQPPRFGLLILPPLVLITVLLTSARGKQHIQHYNTTFLTWLHVVRIPVELVLYSLFVYQFVPELITFGGRNFDILSGITAPIIAVLGYHFKKINKQVLIAWNILCLLLLFNVVTYAVLAAPTVFQQMAFDQPNIGVMYFPFIWLPCFIVPAVLFSHLVCLRELWNRK